jgi:CRISPR-associated protein Cmr5
MNKKVVDQMIPKAVEVLKTAGIVDDGKISKTFRGQISTFGASVMNGSLLAAVAFFSAQGGAAVERQKLMNAINLLINPDAEKKALFDYTKEQVKRNENKCREDILNAAIALKLAMNVYILN